MAIDPNPDVRCARKRHPKGQGPPAAGFVEIPGRGGAYWPHCDDCLEEFRTDPDPIPYPVVYLDPTRQRRPDPDDPRPLIDEYKRAADDLERAATTRPHPV